MEAIRKKAAQMINQDVIVFPWEKEDESSFGTLKETQEDGILLSLIGFHSGDAIDGQEIFMPWEEIEDLSYLDFKEE